MPVVLDPKERDALHAQVLAEFTLFVDLERAIHEGDEEACYKLGRKLSDGLRLLVDGGLGWQRRTVDPTVLTVPDSELRRIQGGCRSKRWPHMRQCGPTGKRVARNGTRSPLCGTPATQC